MPVTIAMTASADRRHTASFRSPKSGQQPRKELNVYLLTSRTIVYLHADDVVRRSVCEPRGPPHPASYPPIIPLLYTPPSPTPLCASIRPITTTPSISVLSHGQSLKAISLKVHAWPYRIILLTNALLGYHLSDAMRTYE